MAYFPNGTAGMAYQERYCVRCRNYRDNGSGSLGCAIWDVHFLFAYGAEGDLKDALDVLIPMDKDGIHAAECSMFLDDGRDHKTLPLFQEGA